MPKDGDQLPLLPQSRNQQSYQPQAILLTLSFQPLAFLLYRPRHGNGCTSATPHDHLSPSSQSHFKVAFSYDFSGCYIVAIVSYIEPNLIMSSKLLKKQLRTFVNQEKADSVPSLKILPSKVVSGTFKVHRDGRKKQRQMLQLQSKSASYTQQRLATEQANMKHNLFVFNRSNQPTEHQLEVAQLLSPKKVTMCCCAFLFKLTFTMCCCAFLFKLTFTMCCCAFLFKLTSNTALESYPSRKAWQQ